MIYSTEEALATGLRASAGQRLWWVLLRGEFERQCELALWRGQWNLASVFATQAQFCREALQARQITERMLK